MQKDELIKQGFEIGCASCAHFINDTCNKYDATFVGTDIPVEPDYFHCWEYDGKTELMVNPCLMFKGREDLRIANEKLKQLA